MLCPMSSKTIPKRLRGKETNNFTCESFNFYTDSSRYNFQIKIERLKRLTNILYTGVPVATDLN